MADRFTYHIFTAPDKVKCEASILSEFLDSGADYVHIRKPEWNIEMVGDLVATIPARYHSRLVLHSFPELALRFCTGFQLNRRFPNVGVPVPLSASCHDLHEVEEAGDFRFVTFSPVFDSISKSGYTSSIDIKEVDFHHFNTRVVALGGVTPDEVPYLKKHGFSGAAFLGCVWNRENGVENMLKSLRMRNVGFQFITDGDGVEQTVNQARDVLEGGCRWIQVRMKGSDIGEIRETLQELLPVCGLYGSTLIVDDVVELADLCHGVHLGQQDTPVVEARGRLSKDKIIGFTVNTVTQIEESEISLPDYYGIGPFRFTKTKKNLAPVLGIDGIRKLSSVAQIPFVAIGGITPDDIPSIIEAGASGVAVSSIITRNVDRVEITRKLTNYLNIYER